MDTVRTSVLPPAALSSAQWNDIWELTREFYEVERSYAEAELHLRQRIALFTMNGALLGMASIDVDPTMFRGRSLMVIHTSHVLLRENWRGRNLIQGLGLRTFLATRLRHPFRPIYWFFDTFSYKSYLLLPRNFRRYWPRFDEPLPDDRRALIDQLAAQRYGPAWRPARGIAAHSSLKRMRGAVAPLVLTAESDPNLRFFSQANPGHAQGDMLACLCPLTLENWLCLARKALVRHARRARR